MIMGGKMKGVTKLVLCTVFISSVIQTKNPQKGKFSACNVMFRS